MCLICFFVKLKIPPEDGFGDFSVLRNSEHLLSFVLAMTLKRVLMGNTVVKKERLKVASKGNTFLA